MPRNYLAQTKQSLDKAEALFNDGQFEEGLAVLSKARTLLGKVNGFGRINPDWIKAKREYESRFYLVLSIIPEDFNLPRLPSRFIPEYSDN
jgi:hypothetical protein